MVCTAKSCLEGKNGLKSSERNAIERQTMLAMYAATNQAGQAIGVEGNGQRPAVVGTKKSSVLAAKMERLEREAMELAGELPPPGERARDRFL